MAGYDREARNNAYFDRGQHATSICGTIGAAAGAAVLLGLGAEGVDPRHRHRRQHGRRE